MEIKPVIEKAVPEDASLLQRIQRKAFQPDIVTYGDMEGCPANETTESILHKISDCDYYKIVLEGRIAGGFVVSSKGGGIYRLKRIFIDPDIQDKGIGSYVMKSLDELYPDARKWSLDTPFKNYRNQCFYEKFGFRKVSENKICENLILFEYEKNINIPENQF